MTDLPSQVTEEQIAAAQLRVVLDAKLGRKTPTQVRKMAAMTPGDDSPEPLQPQPAPQEPSYAAPRSHGSAGKFEVYEDKSGKFRFRLKASNGEIVASGEAYETKAAALTAVQTVQEAAEGANSEEVAS